MWKKLLLLFAIGFIVLVPETGWAQGCGFNQYNDYVCPGTGGAMPVQGTPFALPETTNAVAAAPVATPKSGIDYMAQIRKLQQEMEDQEALLQDTIENPPPESALCGGHGKAPTSHSARHRPHLRRHAPP